uniref:sarcolemmal membrane-associated protein-like n=1 Tax=Epinephelus lanceolatus TaxID=310571 RepID=UPI0014450780|nr:sarcolemmal membrane-associated protein-like [Epinephelus lanceolatus]
MPSMKHDPVTSAVFSADDIPAEDDQTILTSDCAPTAAVCGVVALVVCSLIVTVVRYKWRRAKADLQRKITSLQNELQKRDREEQENIAQVVSSLQGLIKDLEAQRDQVKGELKRVEAEREENKRQLWLVEAEITEREKLFDKPEGLLRDKEKLLQDQWKLDETKRNIERQILNLERVLEPVEIQFSRMIRKRDVQISID